ncbi:MAG: YCII-related protein [Ilumatobacteraceae bacterium]|nr:YCII-related protein [Ilumatobacteraceae bacterium]
MKYMLIIYGNDELWESFDPAELPKVIAETDAQNRALRASGEFIGAYGVGDQVLAKTVHVDNGVPAVTDGPYIEAKEYIGSFTIVDVDGLDRALELAAQNPFARYGQVEVRPIMHEAVEPE